MEVRTQSDPVVRLSIAVQHHPKRRGRLHRIGLEPGFDVVNDPDPSGFPSPWRTYRRALELTPDRATHRLIVQDDARVCRDFESLAFQAVQERPYDLVSLYCGVYPFEHSIAVGQARDRGERWAKLRTSSWVPVVALVWPVELIRSFLSYAPAGDDRGKWSDDANVGEWVRAMKIPDPVCRVPTLVDHDALAPSLIGGGQGRRGVGLA